jgi:hypothetical protein
MIAMARMGVIPVALAEPRECILVRTSSAGDGKVSLIVMVAKMHY